MTITTLVGEGYVRSDTQVWLNESVGCDEIRATRRTVAQKVLWEFRNFNFDLNIPL